MSETEQSPMPSVPPGQTAGALIRAARERQGIHIAVLAAAIKISPRKLDALEGDRYSELPDATFTRALAQTVCRALKIEPAPVMALLPHPAISTLDTVGEGLNTPFRERFSGPDLSGMLPRAPLVWAAIALVLAAGLVYYWPSSAPSSSSSKATVPAAPSPAPAAPENKVAAAPEPAPVAAPSAATPADSFASSAQGAAPLSTTGAAAPPEVADARTGAPVPAVIAPPPLATGASLVASEPVWLEVTDGNGVVVFQRTIQPGENLSFDHTPPLKLKIGNAAAAKLSFRGEPVDLTPFTRGSVARVVLK
jgi:cytoskeleton protein RodZ